MSTHAQLDALIPIAVAAILSGIIGLEREWRHSPAGLRTHMLISMGAALVMVMASGLYGPDAEARLSANVITGVGFLGAGVIIHRKSEVYELTTAASLWLVAMIGMAVGARLYVLAGGTTFLGWFVLMVLRQLTKRSKPTSSPKSAGAGKPEGNI